MSLHSCQVGQTLLPERVVPRQTEIYKVYGQTRTLVWKHRTVVKQSVDKDRKQCRFCKSTFANCPYCTSAPLPRPWQAPTFTIVPKPALYKKPCFRNDKRRLGRSYLCPHCFEYAVVGYQVEQQGRPLWSVPLWNTYIIKELRKLLEVPPNGKKVTLRIVKGIIDNASWGANLGETECMVPVIKKVGGVFHRLKHECTVGCIIGETESKRPVVVNVTAIA